MQDLWESDSTNYDIEQKAFIENLQRWRRKNSGVNYLPPPLLPSLTGGNGCTKANYIIPVVIHVIHDSSDNVAGIGTNISQIQIDNQLEILNHAFSNYNTASSPAVNTGIQFCLAKNKPDGTPFNGITRTPSGETDHVIPANAQALRKIIEYDPERYLNIYVVKSITDPNLPAGALLAGYGNVPWKKQNGQDGVVVDHRFFGDYSTIGNPLFSDSYGITLVHEVGHYLGLFHTFEGGCVGLSSSNCSAEGDLCCDVPGVKEIDPSCPDPSINTCLDLYNNNPADQKQNYMDYSPESCLTTFTPDQTDIMLSTLDIYRNGLGTPQNVNSMDMTCCINSARFNGGTFLCINDSTEFTAYTYSNVTYDWNFYSDGVLAHDTSTTNSTLWFKPDSVGTYDVELIIKENGIVLNQRRTNDLLSVVDCGQSRKSSRGNWYFGEYAGIRFYETGVFRDEEPFNDFIKNGTSKHQIKTGEGTVSMSNEDGDLLFYGSESQFSNYNTPFQLFDKKYASISRDTIMNLPLSASQGAIPLTTQDSDIYVLVHLDYYRDSSLQVTEKLRYSRIDVSDNSAGSEGKVIESNLEVFDSLGNSYDNLGEGLAATYATDTSFWVFAHDFSSNRIQQFLATDDTIVFHSSTSANSVTQSQIRLSPNGRFLTIDRQLFRFDPKSGNLDHLHSISGVNRVYGACFSPDSRILYRNEGIGVGLPRYEITQYDLGSSATDFSRKVVGEHYGGRRSLQLGPDSLIYIAANRQTSLPRINNPNALDYGNNECGLLDDQIDLGNSGQLSPKSNEGLPNYIDGVQPDSLEIDFNYKLSNCTEVSFWVENAFGNSYSWTFGDGNTSTSKDPVHTYSTTGTYTVTLTQDGVSSQKDIEVLIPASDLVISGNTKHCDTNQIFEYTVIERPWYNYTWSITNNNNISAVGNRAFAVWKADGDISVVVENTRTGCKDSSDLSVTQGLAIFNNSISPNSQVICDSSSASLLVGSFPLGGNGIFTYQWFKSIDNGNSYQGIPNAAGQSYLPTDITITTKLYRRVSSDGCHTNSNEVEIQELGSQNKIYIIDELCYPGGTISLEGAKLVSGVGYTTTYSWEKSEDGTTWTVLVDSTKDLIIDQTEDSAFYRRKATWRPHWASSYCTTYSNTQFFSPTITVEEQPEDIDVCGNSSSYWTINTTLSNPKNYAITFVLQYKEVGGTTWVESTGNQGSVTEVYGFPNSPGTDSDLDSIRFKFNTPCGAFFSDIAVIRAVDAAPNISSHPSNAVINAGEDATFTAAISNELDSSSWQVKEWHSSVWVDITSQYWDTLRFDQTNICQDSNQYRLKATNLCGTTYSNAATLTASDLSDLWMRDSHKDTGATP
ncbi:MAG: PKD domain-containing protein, partial [Bacteroidia bacterium]|nr:PKD domain-containing protein [Bacteroidia bacterium]